MNKLIIDNQTDMDMNRAIRYVLVVIDKGKISNNGKQYCYVTAFNDEVVVTSILNKKSERLLITKLMANK